MKEPVSKLYGDGAYDRWHVYGELDQRGIAPVIPPRRDAAIKQHGNCKAKPLARDEAIRHICCKGRSGWKEEVGYHRRSLIETCKSRMEQAFGYSR